MRLLLLVGLGLIVGGTYLLYERPTFSRRHDVVEIGDFKASLREQEPVPIWIGPVLIGLGVGALIAGVRGRRRPD